MPSASPLAWFFGHVHPIGHGRRGLRVARRLQTLGRRPAAAARRRELPLRSVLAREADDRESRGVALAFIDHVARTADVLCAGVGSANDEPTSDERQSYPARGRDERRTCDRVRGIRSAPHRLRLSPHRGPARTLATIAASALVVPENLDPRVRRFSALRRASLDLAKSAATLTHMRSVTVHEAKTTLSKLLVAVEAGEEIIVCRGDKPVARLVPLRAAARPRPRADEVTSPRVKYTDDCFAALDADDQALWGLR